MFEITQQVIANRMGMKLKCNSSWILTSTDCDNAH